MDPFTQLPPELLAQILVYTADFSAVESLISISPHANAVLHAQPTIVRDLILADPIACLPEIQKMCHDISLIQTYSAEFPSLVDYQQRCPPTQYTEGELTIFMLHLTARTQRLACTCLTMVRQNFVSALDSINAGDMPSSDRIKIVREPFSFTEEYRVYSSLWHLQHYSCLREAAERWHWDEASMLSLDAYNRWNDTGYRSVERMWTIAAPLSDLGLKPIYGHYPFQQKQRYLAQDPEGEESSRAAWTFDDETPLPFFRSFDLISRPSSETWTPPLPPPETEAIKVWSLGVKNRKFLGGHVGDFRRTSSFASLDRAPPSHGFVRFKHWRRLGLVIWDSWRIHRIGLFEPPRNPGEEFPTPDGGHLPVVPTDDDERAQISLVDYTSRWLALIGEKLPFPRGRGRVGGRWRNYVP